MTNKNKNRNKNKSKTHKKNKSYKKYKKYKKKITNTGGAINNLFSSCNEKLFYDGINQENKKISKLKGLNFDSTLVTNPFDALVEELGFHNKGTNKTLDDISIDFFNDFHNRNKNGFHSVSYDEITDKALKKIVWQFARELNVINVMYSNKKFLFNTEIAKNMCSYKNFIDIEDRAKCVSSKLMPLIFEKMDTVLFDKYKNDVPLEYKKYRLYLLISFLLITKNTTAIYEKFLSKMNTMDAPFLSYTQTDYDNINPADKKYMKQNYTKICRLFGKSEKMMDKLLGNYNIYITVEEEPFNIVILKTSCHFIGFKFTNDVQIIIAIIFVYEIYDFYKNEYNAYQQFRWIIDNERFEKIKQTEPTIFEKFPFFSCIKSIDNLELDNKRTPEYTVITELDNLITKIEENNLNDEEQFDNTTLKQSVTTENNSEIQSQNQDTNKNKSVSQMVSAATGTLAGLATGYVYLLGGSSIKKYKKNNNQKLSRKHKKTRKQNRKYKNR